MLESKGEEKAKILKVMEVKKTRVKKTRVSEEVSRPSASMETEEEGTTSKKRKKRAGEGKSQSKIFCLVQRRILMTWSKTSVVKALN